MATTASRLRRFSLSSMLHHSHILRNPPHLLSPRPTSPFPPLPSSSSSSSSSLPNFLQKLHFSSAAGSNGAIRGGGGLRPIGGFLNGWRSRVSAYPQFPPLFSSSSSSPLPTFLPKLHFSSSAAGNGAIRGGGLGHVGGFLNGWRSRVAADPQFPFKVLMEQLVGVTACVLGDMATRPNYGLNELDFVFSTLIVSSILNFILMYLLSPTAAQKKPLPSIFANSPTSHMFEPGSFSLLNRFGTLAYKGVLFAAVGFAAGLVGTAISNGLIEVRKKMDPSFETPNEAPPTVLNAATWAVHMGVSSNLRYQSLNGAEFLLAKSVPPAVFKAAVVVLRCLNNVIGGMSFVILARLTGSQSVKGGKEEVVSEREDPSTNLQSN